MDGRENGGFDKRFQLISSHIDLGLWPYPED